MSDVSMRILLSAQGGPQVTRAMQEVAKSLGASGLAGALRTEAQAAEQSASATRNAGTAAESSGFSFLNLASKVGMAIFGFQNIYNTLKSVGSALLMPNAQLEQTTVAFTNLLGSTDAANKAIKDLKTFAAQTPFEFSDLADSTQMLLGFGFQLKQTKPLLTAIGDAMSAMGTLSSANLKGVTMIFGQIHASGHVMTQDLQQLTSYGINGFAILAQQMHKTVPEIQAMVTKGLIPSDQAIQLLTQGIEQNPIYAGGMAKQSQTFLGLLSTLKDNLTQAFQAFTSPLFDAAKQGLLLLGNLVSSQAFQDFAKLMGEKIAGAFAAIGDFLGKQVLPRLQFLADMLRHDLAPAFDAIKGLLGDVAGQFQNVSVSLDIDKVWRPFTTIVHTLATDFSALVVGVGQGKGPFGDLHDKVKAIFDLFQSAGGQAFGNFMGLFKQIVQGASTGKGAFGSLNGVLSGLAGIFQSLAQSGLKDVVDLFKALATGASGSAQNFLSDFLPIWQQIATFVAQTLIPAFQQFLPTFEGIVQLVIQEGVPAFFHIKDALVDVVTSIMSLWLPIWEQVWPILLKVGGIVLQVGGFLYNLLIPAISSAAQAVGGFAKEMATRLAPFMASVGDGIKHLSDFIMFVWNFLWPWMSVVLKTAWDDIKGVISLAWTAISGIFKLFADILSGNWSQFWTDLKDLGGKLWGKVKEWFGTLWDDIKDVWNTLGDKIKEGFKLALDWIWQHILPDWAKDLINAIHTRWESIKSTWDEKWTEFKAGVKAILDDIWQNVMPGWAKDLIGWIQTNVPQAWHHITDALDDFGSWVGDAFSKASDAVVGFFKTYITGPITDAFNNSIGSWKNLWNDFLRWIAGTTNKEKIGGGHKPGTLSEPGGSAPPQQHFASGGRVPFSGPIEVGEQGREWLWANAGDYIFNNQQVNRLSRMPTGGGGVVYGGHTFYITLQTNFAPTPQQARDAVDMIAQELGKQMRLSTPGYSSGGVF